MVLRETVLVLEIVPNKVDNVVWIIILHKLICRVYPLVCHEQHQH
eukprot:COSAG01_NODE_48050_length_384_cov_1.354386_1_plen_44_part_10